LAAGCGAASPFFESSFLGAGVRTNELDDFIEDPMRQIRYSVAMSLDAYIAGPDGEFDWIIMDPDIDSGEMFSRYDTLACHGSSHL